MVEPDRKSAHHSPEACPECRYTLSRRSTWCPYCGVQLTHPPWKKVGAWILLVLIVYGLVQCHLRLLDGPDGLNSLP
jgi:RNA polymerase subunit RPABC4/transcription elongation factor Spt4